MRKMLLVLGFLLAGTVSGQEGLSSRAVSTEEAKRQMEQLSSEALTETVAVVQESGGFYPYAMVMRPDTKVHVVAYSGSKEDKPPATKFAHTLYWQVADLLSQDQSFIAAVLLRPHILKTEDKGNVPGIWALVDHRYHAPVVMFLPFVSKDDGTHGLGDVVYLPSTDPLFLAPGAEIPATVENSPSDQ